MTKEQLATCLNYVACTSPVYDFRILVYYPFPNDNKEQFIREAAGSAGVKLVKGKISCKSNYVVSRGRELPLEPSAVVEYSIHWPYDFCYFYKL